MTTPRRPAVTRRTGTPARGAAARRRVGLERLEDRLTPTAQTLFTWAGTPVAIPDPVGGVVRTVTVPLTVADSFAAGDIDVTVHIRHDIARELGLVLEAPDGRKVRLAGFRSSFDFDPLPLGPDERVIDEPGYFFEGVTTYGGDFRGLTFDDAAISSIRTAPAPYTGRYRPESPLDALLVGPGGTLDARGTWKLHVTDFESFDPAYGVGEVVSWTLGLSGSRERAGSVSGSVFYAGTVNPARGVRVYIDADGDGVRSPTEASAVTGLDGTYRIDGVALAGVQVRADVPDPSRLVQPGPAESTLWSADFAAGGNGFSFAADPLGRDAVNLWHHDPARAGGSLYFGVAGVNGAADSYRAGSYGTAYSEVIDLSGTGGPVALRMLHELRNEVTYDIASVGVVIDGREVVLASTEREIGGLRNPTDGPEWASIDLSAFAGKRFRLFFRFAADCVGQDAGWTVRELRLVAGGPALVVAPRPARPDVVADWFLTAPAVDLRAASFSADARLVRPGEEFTLRFAVANRGDGPASPFTASVRLVDPATGLPVGPVLASALFSGLPGGAEFESALPVVLPDAPPNLDPMGRVRLGLFIDGAAFGNLADTDAVRVALASTVARAAAVSSPAAAQDLYGPTVVVSHEAPAGGGDFFRLRFDEPVRLAAALSALTGSALQARLVLTDEGGSELLRADAGAGGPAGLSRYLPAGTYFLRVGRQTAGTGGYALDVLFAPAADPFQGIAVGDRPQSLQLADLDGDGRDDLVVALTGGRGVVVMYGDGAGSFGEARTYYLGGAAGTVVVADADGDGLAELVVTLPDDDLVAVLRNLGGGRFAAPSLAMTGSEPSSAAVLRYAGGPLVAVAGRGDGTLSFFTFDALAGVRPAGPPAADLGAPGRVVAADIDGDGADDAVVSHDDGSGLVTVLFGGGAAPYAAAETFALDASDTTGLVAADLDRDGRPDFLSADYDAGTLVFFGSRGEYASPASFAVGAKPSAVRLGDLDGDGLPDAVVANSAGNDVSVLLGSADPDRPFRVQRRYAVPAGADPRAIDLADLDGDGDLDLVAANAGGGTVGVLLNNGDGSFRTRERVSAAVYPSRVAVADVNADGVADILSVEDGGRLTVLLGNGDGSFRGEQVYALGEVLRPRLTVADVNGDRRPDVLLSGDFAGAGGIRVALGNGDGSFQSSRFFATGGGETDRVLVADLDADGRGDLVVADTFDVVVTVFFADRRAAFGFLAPRAVYIGELPTDVAVADFDGDGRADLAVASRDTGRVTVLYGPFTASGGELGYDGSAVLDAGGGVSGVAAVPDADGDGRPELAATNAGDNVVRVFVTGGPGRDFGAGTDYPVGSGPESLLVTDLDGDRRADLVTVNRTGGDVTVLRGLPGGTFDAGSTFAVGMVPVAVAVSRLTGDATPDLLVAREAGDFRVLLGTGGAAFEAAADELALETRTAPLSADLDGDRVNDLVTLNRTGQILFRRVLGGGEYAPPVILNAAGPAVVDVAAVRTPAGVRLAAASGTRVLLFDATGRAPSVLFASASRAQRLAAADLDGDGLSDLVVTHPLDGTVTVATQLSGPRVRFDARSPVAVGAAPADVAFADIDGDRRPDVLVNSRAAAEVVVLSGRDGFSRAAHYSGSPAAAGTSADGSGRSFDRPVGLAVGRFTADARPDVAVVSRGTKSVSLLTGTAAGLGPAARAADLFGPPDSRAGMAAAADFNGDGLTDLAVLDEQASAVWVLLNRGGSFAPAYRVAAGNSPLGLTAADVTGDGRIDLVVGNGFGDVLVLPGNGRGTFAPFVRADRNTPFVLADLDGDGDKDMVVASQSGDVARAYLRVGGGFVPAPATFSQDKTNLQGPGAVRLADLDGDGRRDLIIANSGGNSVLVFAGTAAGFAATPVTLIVGTNPVSVTVAHLNGDGRADLVVADKGSNDVAVLFNDSESGIAFSAGPRLRTNGSGPVEVRVRDVTDASGRYGSPDGIADLLVRHEGSADTTFLRGLGDGFFDDTRIAAPVRGDVSVGGAVLPPNVRPESPDIESDGGISFFDAATGRYFLVAAPAGVPVSAVTVMGANLLLARDDGSLALMRPDGAVVAEYGVGLFEEPNALEVLATDVAGVFDLIATNGTSLDPVLAVLDLRPDLAPVPGGDAAALALALVAGDVVAGAADAEPGREISPEAVDNLLVGPLAGVGRPAEEGADEEPEAEEDDPYADGEYEPPPDDGTTERDKEALEEALRELGLPVPGSPPAPAEVPAPFGDGPPEAVSELPPDVVEVTAAAEEAVWAWRDDGAGPLEVPEEAARGATSDATFSAAAVVGWGDVFAQAVAGLALAAGLRRLDPCRRARPRGASAADSLASR